MKHATPVIQSLFLGIILTGLAVAGASAASVSDLAKDCEHCHGSDGASKDSGVPIIGGMPAYNLTEFMTAYRDEERPCPEFKYPEGPDKGKKVTMCEIADDISEDDTTALADHYAAKPFIRATQEIDAALAEKGKEVHEKHCEKCHAEGGSLASDEASILAGQWVPYLEETFKNISDGTRPQPKKMKKKTKKLDAADMKALVNYYGSFK